VADCDAIHRDAIERRLVPFRTHILVENAPGRRGKRDLFAWKGRYRCGDGLGGCGAR
jgi:hypothetical protein